MITATDKRTPAPGFSTGTPVQAEPADAVMVQPTTTYMEGSKIVGPQTPPYPASRHHAEELKNHGFATYAEVELISEVDVSSVDLIENESVVRLNAAVEEAARKYDAEHQASIRQPDDQARTPGQDQVTASTVPARPGAEPQRTAPGPVPPAATSDAPQPARRRGRQAARKG